MSENESKQRAGQISKERNRTEREKKGGKVNGNEGKEQKSRQIGGREE